MELVGMYVNTDSNEQDGENTEVDDSVNQNGNPTGTHVPKLHHPCPCRWEKESNLPPKFVGEWVGLIFLVKKEMNDAKLRDKEDSRFEGEERINHAKNLYIPNGQNLNYVNLKPKTGLAHKKNLQSPGPVQTGLVYPKPNQDSGPGLEEGEMADWGPVVIAVVLFVLLTPGLLFQLPGNNRVVEFGNMQTSGISILVHTIIYFGLITIFLIAIGVHIYTG
ncbi:hypothetical protein CK203_067634 [Vitis vinifera]|uniref:Transmembrane protein n=2 Tax=Vitis TaxID=3603 RepID=A0A438EBE6_VITVI|nr:hypothetical protein CK203_067634 [Vitis vinifera]